VRQALQMDQGILGRHDFLFLQGDLVALLFLEGLFLLVFLAGLQGQVSQQVRAVPCVLEHLSLQGVPIN